MTRRRSPSTRSLQLGFLVLLFVCAAQLAFWMFDEVRYTRDVTQRLREAYVAVGAPAERVEALEEDRNHRLNRYAWEGAFFLAVLLAAMGVVYRALREEAELRRRQEQFLAAVSHEFKSPLASLRLSVETLSLRDPAVAQRVELLRRVMVELGRLERMVSNTLEASRLEAGGRVDPYRVDVGTELQEALVELEEFAKECGVELRVLQQDRAVVLSDRDEVRTVIRNLLHNALKASSQGQAVSVAVRGDGGSVVLEVRDAGVGFPPADAPRLFEQFYRVEGDGSGRMQGTGLGLYLVDRLVRHAGGRVSAESAGLGQGATFTVTWPAAGDAA